MKAADHIVAWIESDRRHYNRLLDLCRRRQPDCPDGFIRAFGVAAAAHNIASSAYARMVMTGDASRDDPYSATDILQAAIALAEWELEN